VGAISAHGVVGIFGVMAVVVTGGASFMAQLIGVVSIALFTFIASFIVVMVINSVMPIRATDEEQDIGLDVSEIGIEAYPEFK
jgi:Amt family ammonium transporter